MRRLSTDGRFDERNLFFTRELWALSLLVVLPLYALELASLMFYL
jgi:hypothetical protein